MIEQSYAKYSKSRVIDQCTKRIGQWSTEMTEYKNYFIEKRRASNIFWNKWTLGLIKLKNDKELAYDIASSMSLSQCWHWSDMVCTRDWYKEILDLAVNSDDDFVYLSTKDAKIFSEYKN